MLSTFARDGSLEGESCSDSAFAAGTPLPES